jgi:hypothetical protein
MERDALRIPVTRADPIQTLNDSFYSRYPQNHAACVYNALQTTSSPTSLYWAHSQSLTNCPVQLAVDRNITLLPHEICYDLEHTVNERLKDGGVAVPNQPITVKTNETSYILTNDSDNFFTEALDRKPMDSKQTV